MTSSVKEAVPRGVNGIKGVIWDLDGTLLDTEELSSQALQMVLDPFEKKEDWELKKKLLGRRAPEWCEIVIEELGLDRQKISADEIHSGWEANLKELIPLVEKCEGAEAITQYFSEISVPQAIATSSLRESVKIKRLKHEEMFGRMEFVVTGDLVSKGKPDPSIYLLAASKLGLQPSECIAFEDSMAGLESAVAAGMKCIAIVDPRWNEEEREAFFEKGASLVGTSLSALEDILGAM
jgi:beta-phosphoglucomutase-like phosphatase (HAD superfamily)